MRVVRALLATILVLAAQQVLQPRTASADAGCITCGGNGVDPVVSGDPVDGVIRGSIRFANEGSESALNRMARNADSCGDCEWAVTPACQDVGPDDPDGGLCVGANVLCTPPSIRFRVFFRDPPAPWQQVGTTCFPPGDGPRTARSIGPDVRDAFIKYLPHAKPSFQPVGGAIVNLPTIFDAGVDERMKPVTFDVAGFEVTVSATATYTWRFDRGVERTFDERGGAYPDKSVTWTYRSTGDRSVVLTTSWTGSYTIGADGPYAVPGGAIDLVADPLTLPVRQARAQLVSPP